MFFGRVLFNDEDDDDEEDAKCDDCGESNGGSCCCCGNGIVVLWVVFEFNWAFLLHRYYLRTILRKK